MRYPFETQKDLKDCGVCCLLMLTRYYGGGVSKEYLREITNTTKSGVSAYGLIEGSKKIGFDSYGVKGNLNDIHEQNLPCIAHVVIKKSFEHFIVIYKINKKKKNLIVADPNKGIKKMSFDEFLSISTNTYIFLKPKKKIMYVDKNTKLKEFIYSKLKENLSKIISVVLLSTIITILSIFLSFQFKIVLEYVIDYNNSYNLILLSFILLAFVLLKEISNYSRNKTINIFNHDLDCSLQEQVYNHILSLPYLYYKNRTTGEIVSRMNDLSSIRDLISKFIVSLLIDSVLMLGSLVTLFLLCSRLTLIIILIIFLLLIFVLIFNNELDKKITMAKEKGAKLNSYLIETIGGIETIKNQNIVSYAKRNFLIKYLKYNKNSLSYNNTFITLDFIKNLIISIGNLLVLIIGSYLVVDNKLDVATLITYISLNNYVFSPIENISDLILSFKEAKISYNRIRELYEIEEEKEKTSKSNNIIGKIKSLNLTYSYNNIYPILKDINLDINPNEKVLIYGKSGSGKSTLAKIMSGQLKVDNNFFFYNDKDINKYNTSAIRKDICYISSKETLFTDSIYNNIVLDKDVSEDTFDDVVRICMVDEFVDNKNLAYDMLLEEDGFNLSGGQKQRIILARSLLKNSNIYILDEALNQIDITKERQILNNLFKKYPDKTFIYISHRFHNSDLFDKKYRIEDGVSYNETI